MWSRVEKRDSLCPCLPVLSPREEMMVEINGGDRGLDVQHASVVT